MQQPIPLKQRLEIIEKKLYGLNRKLLNGLEVTIYPKCDASKRVDYQGRMIQVYFYVKNKPYPESYIGCGIESLQKRLGVNKKTAILILIAKITELYKEIEKDAKFENKAKILEDLSEKLRKYALSYSMPMYSKTCPSCGRRFKTKHQDHSVCSHCYYYQNQKLTPKKKKPEPKNKCKRCNTEIPEKYEYCKTCKQVLILRGELQGEIRT